MKKFCSNPTYYLLHSSVNMGEGLMRAPSILSPLEAFTDWMTWARSRAWMGLSSYTLDIITKEVYESLKDDYIVCEVYERYWDFSKQPSKMRLKMRDKTRS